MRRFKDRPKSIFSGSPFSNDRLSYTEASIERKAQREMRELEQENTLDVNRQKRKRNGGKHLWEIDKSLHSQGQSESPEDPEKQQSKMKIIYLLIAAIGIVGYLITK